jgi:hypothetical protein
VGVFCQLARLAETCGYRTWITEIAVFTSFLTTLRYSRGFFAHLLPKYMSEKGRKTARGVTADT